MTTQPTPEAGADLLDRLRDEWQRETENETFSGGATRFDDWLARRGLCIRTQATGAGADLLDRMADVVRKLAFVVQKERLSPELACEGMGLSDEYDRLRASPPQQIAAQPTYRCTLCKSAVVYHPNEMCNDCDPQPGVSDHRMQPHPTPDADAVATGAGVGDDQRAFVRRINYTSWMRGIGGCEPPVEWQEAYSAGYAARCAEDDAPTPDADAGTWFCPGEHPSGKHGPKCRRVNDDGSPTDAEADAAAPVAHISENGLRDLRNGFAATAFPRDAGTHTLPVYLAAPRAAEVGTSDNIASHVYGAVFAAMIDGGAHVTQARMAAEKFSERARPAASDPTLSVLTGPPKP
jgi:hypothetical protein